MDLTPALVEYSPRNRIDLIYLLCWMRSKRVNVKYTHFLYRFENYNVIVNAFKKLVSNHELQFVAISNGNSMAISLTLSSHQCPLPLPLPLAL